MSEEKQERKDSRMSAFTGLGSLIGIMIGGVNFGIMGAVVGGVLGTILVSSGIEVQIKDLKAKGKFHPFKGAALLSYFLAFVLTAAVIMLAPVVNDFLTEGGKTDRFMSLIVLFVGPAIAGSVGALIPVWMSAGSNTD